MRWRTLAIRLAALLAALLALASAALAVDVLRMPGELEGDDVRFEAAPRRHGGVWNGLGLLPADIAAGLLDVGDDLAYRHTVARFLRVEPGVVPIFGPELENVRGNVQLELTQRSATDSNPQRRSRLLNFLAVMSLERYGTGPESDNILRRAVHTLRSAVETDPENADAKLNLELALRNAKAANLPGTDPNDDPSQGRLSGQGRSGSGY